MLSQKRNCRVLVQKRDESPYNDFLGKFYHFPEYYLPQFSELPLEFIYYEPNREKGGYFGYGRIEKAPFEDKREKGQYFVEISEYKSFSEKVGLKDENDMLREDDSYYNPQNAVREISKEKLDDICLEGGINLTFRADAHLIRVLGEQLIASERVGILELIKNSYDAQASYCRVRIEKVEGLQETVEPYEFGEYQGPVIVIEDDGIGMTQEIIEKGWLRPASTIKTNVKERMNRERKNAIDNNSLGIYESLISQLKKEYKGRIPLGEKGVGRFATHRLGRGLILKTKVKEYDYEFILKINWDDFDKITENGTDLDSISVSLTKQPPSRNYGKGESGTQLIIFGGRDGFNWDAGKIRSLNDSITKINTPNPGPGFSDNLFRVYLECPQIPDLKSYDITKDFYPIFTFIGLVDKNGVLDYSLEFQPPSSIPMAHKKWEETEFDLRLADKDNWIDSTKPTLFRASECGPFYIHINVWYRTTPWVAGVNARDFTDYLTDFGGISIYRDGINIFPAEWGAETDWLNLSKRNIKQGWRMSYYNMIGNIEIDQTKTPYLSDKTDREGLIKNKAFEDLQQLVYLIIDRIIEPKFKEERDKFHDLTSDITRNPRELSNYVRQNEILITNIIENYPIKKDPYEIFKKLAEQDDRDLVIEKLQKSMENLKESIELIREAQNLLTEQAGYGLAIAVTLHEITKSISNYYSGIMRIMRSGNIDVQKITEILTESQFLNLELGRLRPLRATRIEDWVEFKIIKSVKFVTGVFGNRLKKENIELQIEGQGDFQIFGRYAAVNQVLTNLMDNSCYWLGTILDRERLIVIKIDETERQLIVADNGPGLHPSILKYLFEPGYSLRKDASGLGLYICKYYMQDMKGDIYVTPEKQRIKSISGAQFTLKFKGVAQEREEVK